MRILFIIIFALLSLNTSAQKKRAKFPSYFGFRISPVFPTQFIGERSLTLNQDVDDTFKLNTTINQKIGYSFGATVRAGITKFVAFETGLNFTQRSFELTMEIPDSSISATNDFKFIAYDLPINALFYIQLDEKWFMNASLGAIVTFAPTHVGVSTSPVKRHVFYHTGLVNNKVGVDLNANVGFEFRTEKDGFFYIGGSARVPFKPLFDLYMQYEYTGSDFVRVLSGPVDGSFLSIDFKYFFPNIKNRGTQFQKGPIEQ